MYHVYLIDHVYWDIREFSIIWFSKIFRHPWIHRNFESPISDQFRWIRSLKMLTNNRATIWYHTIPLFDDVVLRINKGVEEIKNIESARVEYFFQITESPQCILRININIADNVSKSRGFLVPLIFREHCQFIFVAIIDVNNRAIRSFLGIPINLPINSHY